MRVAVNYVKEHVLQVPEMLEKGFRSIEGVEVVGINQEPEIVVNSMPFNGIVKGTKKTVYWELDIAEFNHAGEYHLCDIVYFPSNMRKDLWNEKSRFLPMAVDPEYYHPIDMPIDHDVVFMGRMDRSLRVEYIEKLKRTFKVSAGTETRGEPTSRALSSGRCSFQISEFRNLEQRNFEYSAVVPMVLERVPDIELFTEDEHYKGFNRENYQEFEDQIRWCIDHTDQALLMRDRMIEHLKEHHTYVHRAKTILEDLV